MLARRTDLVVLAIAFGIHTYISLRRSLSTSGVIVGEARVHDPDNDSLSFAPVFSFATANGQTYTITSTVSSNPPEFSVGQHVKVLYKEGDPRVARLESFRQLWTMGIVLSSLGLIGSTTGLVLLKMERRRTLQLA